MAYEHSSVVRAKAEAAAEAKKRKEVEAAEQRKRKAEKRAEEAKKKVRFQLPPPPPTNPLPSCGTPREKTNKQRNGPDW